MFIYHKGKKLVIPVTNVSFIRKGIGLMFRTRNTSSLSFEFSDEVNLALTSYFVFFPFLAIWLDKKNQVVDFRIVYPFTLSVAPSTKFNKLVEVPFNEENRKLIKFFVGGGKV
jgi:uncharacterized membrane protein (UPF0127 family)